MQQETSKTTRSVYSTPELRVYGDVATLTQTSRRHGTVNSDVVWSVQRSA